MLVSRDAQLRPARVLIVVGTRPEVIKMSPVARALREDPHVLVSVCVVAQQGQILDQAVAEWQLSPDYRIDLPGDDPRLTCRLAAMLPALADCIDQLQPQVLMVEGDTTTNLAAALAAFYAGVPVAHVEAGLRSGDVRQPFPEEMHRVLVDRIASIHYAPTQGARENLLAEAGHDSESVLVVGNTVIDALLAASSEPVPTLGAWPDGRRLLLVTAHRRESFGRGIESICRAVRELATSRPDLDVIFVLHSNPAARVPVQASLGLLANVRLIEPQPYRSFIRLLASADLVLTDSGGVQEEAPYLGTPVLVTRAVTERPEASQAGAAQIVGTDARAIVDAVSALLDDPQLYERMSRLVAPYGDGTAAKRISRDLVRRLIGETDADTTEIAVPLEPDTGAITAAPFEPTQPAWGASQP
jgi:UDP-N-acetylglucosamine 2-epimerase (non-hydrolysing)